MLSLPVYMLHELIWNGGSKLEEATRSPSQMPSTGAGSPAPQAGNIVCV